MPKTQHYGISFPITIKSDEKTLLDLNTSRADMVRSEIIHCLFTPKGQRLRQPGFGSRLIQFIFNPNDGDSWGDIVDEVKTMISTWIPDCKISDINIVETDDGRGLKVVIRYSISEADGSRGEYVLAVPV